MKYVSQLSDKELEEIFRVFMADDDVFESLEICRFDNCIDLNGAISFPDNENPGDMLTVEENYSLTDYDVKVYTHSGDVTQEYRKYMYSRFGDVYAKEFLLGYEEEEVE